MGKINLKLLPLKFLLFFLFAAIGCLPAFLTIHMYHIGLTHEEVTWINTVLPLTALGGPPLVGYLADRFGHYRLITIVSMFIAGVFHTSLLFVPERTAATKPDLQMICSSQGSRLVLQSCTEDCPQILQSSAEGKFRIGSCRHECDMQKNNCADLGLRLKNSTNYSNDSLPPEKISEISLEKSIPPTICFHDNSSIKCENFAFNTFVEIKREHLRQFSTAEKSYFKRYADCCEYSFDFYLTTTNTFDNLTCGHLPDCYVVCSVTEMSNGSYLLQSPVCSTEGSGPEVTFWLYFCLRAVADMFPAILITLFDAVVLTMVSQHGGDYGRQKMFGLFAVGTSAPVVGYLMDRQVGVYGKYIYSPVFYAFDLLLILTAIITIFLPLKIEVQRTSMLKNMATLIRTSEFNILLLLVIILGSLNGYLETFLYVYLSKDLGASNLLLGFTITVGIVPSVPFLYKSDLIVRYCGHHYLLMLAFVGYCIRFAGLSYISNPLWVIPLEVLELFTLNLMQVTAVTLAYKLAPKQLLATAQGLVWISHFDIGRALGTIIGGYLIKVYGMTPVFQMACVFSAICAGLYLLIHFVLRSVSKKSKRKEREKERQKKESIMNGNYIPLQMMDEKN